ncbi:unnamed protein product [Polarella glacialis]|nr:unnamed protein product [Polarella glacialis]CAE8663077.1 unnamed protein product [Polarella glacialis]
MALQDSFAVSGQKTLAGIVRTNSFMRGDSASDATDMQVQGVLYAELSRFNHSCAPNAEQSWDGKAGELQVYASRDIARGEELCLYYVDVRAPTLDRASLLEVFGFRCACAACTATDAASDQRRTRIRELVAETPAVAEEDAEQALQMVVETLDLYEQEGLCSASFGQNACFMAYQLSLGLEEFGQAEIWAKKAFEYSLLCHGATHATTRILKRHASRQRQ